MTPGERDPKIIEEFNRRRKRQLVVAALLIASIICLSMAKRPTQRSYGRAQGFTILAALVGAVVFSFKNWRCPSCNKYLGKTLFMAFCPLCGVPLK